MYLIVNESHFYFYGISLIQISIKIERGEKNHEYFKQIFLK